MAASSSSTATWSESIVDTIGATPMVRIRRSLPEVEVRECAHALAHACTGGLGFSVRVSDLVLKV